MSEFKRALYPVVVQDFITGEILMLAYADKRAVELTQKTGFAHFYSRKRKTLWKKGETSGNFIPVFEIIKDCDEDSFIYLTHSPPEHVCHLKKKKCFYEKNSPFLIHLENFVRERVRKKVKNSYTVYLLNQESDEEILRKIGEEAVEVILAKENWLDECADLVFHIILLCLKRKKSLRDIFKILFERHLRMKNK